MELTIAFTLIVCVCGVERQAGRDCPGCGREPDEVDEELERRRAIVKAVSERKSVENIEPLILDEAFGLLREWLERFGAAYEATASGTVVEAAAALRESLSQLDALEVRAEHAHRRRPEHSVWAAVDGVIHAFIDVRSAYLAALEAETPDDAKTASARGQTAIDAAAEALARFNDLAEAWEHVSSSDISDEHGDLLASAGAVAALSGTADMVELDRAGAVLLARITGDEDVAAPAGLGVGLQLLDFAVETTMDPARFWKVARRAYELFSKDKIALRGLCSDTNWRTDLAVVSLEVRDAAFEAAAVASAGGNRRRLVRSALRLAAMQIEGAAQPLLATLLALIRRKPYDSERTRDVNELLVLVDQSGQRELLLGLDPKLRDADAHRAFEIDDHGVRLTGTRGDLDYLSDAELIDMTLAGTESIAALYWGLIAALIASGVDIEELEGVLGDSIAEAEKIKLVLLLYGWHDVVVRIEGDHAIAHGEREGENAMGVVGAVVSVLSESRTQLTLVATDERGTHTASGSAALIRAWNDADEPMKELAFISAAMAWRIDDVPIAPRAHVEQVFAYRTLEALDPKAPHASALGGLRTLMEASRALDNEALSVAITAAVRLRREVAAGARLTRSPEQVVSALDPWLIELPEIRSSW